MFHISASHLGSDLNCS